MDDQTRLGDGITLATRIIGEGHGRIVVFSDFINTIGPDPYEVKEEIESDKIAILFYDIKPEHLAYQELLVEEVEEVISEDPVFVIENEIVENTTIKQLYIEFEENTIYVVDLYEYYKDADQDVLNFTATEMENIDIKIVYNTMTLKPAKNWVGEESFTLTADDGRGGVTVSPAIIVRVTDGKDAGGEPMDLTYLWWALGIILLLLIVIGLYVLRAVLTEKPGKKGPDKKAATKKGSKKPSKKKAKETDDDDFAGNFEDIEV